MAARDTGAMRTRLNGPDAQRYVGVARTQMGILKELMAFGNLPQLSRTVTLGDGTRIFVQSVFGQDTIRIDRPVEVVEVGGGEEVAGAVNRVTDYVGVMMPNPVPYRGVSIGVVDTSGISDYGTAYVMASDATVISSETWANNHGSPPRYQYTPMFTQWSGGDNVWMFDQDSTNVTTIFNHKLNFTVPEDCIYPTPSVTAPTYNWYDAATQAANWAADWAAGITAFNARRKAWFKKNSDEFMAALKGKFQSGAVGVTRAELQTGSIPASWDYQIKSQYGKNYAMFQFQLADGSYAGRHTKMPIVMSVTYADAVLSDTSAGLSQAGTMVTQRAATFQYVDANGANQTAVVNGLLTQGVTVSMYVGSTPVTAMINVDSTYSNWYGPAGYPGILPPHVSSIDALLKTPFLQDVTAASLGNLWAGRVVNSYGYFGYLDNPPMSDSTWGAPLSPLGLIGRVSPMPPPYSNTLVGTAAPLYLQYHNTVLPQYVSNTAQSSTVMNNSGMYHVKQIELCLFGPAPGGQAIGIFADPTDADGATQIAYYGEASLLFDWSVGSLTLIGWNARKDANGNDAPAIVPLPAGYSYRNSSGTLYFNDGTANYTQAYNCAIGYVWDSPDQMWPDVAEYLRLKIAQMLAGQGDQVLYTVIRQALAL